MNGFAQSSVLHPGDQVRVTYHLPSPAIAGCGRRDAELRGSFVSFDSVTLRLATTTGPAVVPVACIGRVDTRHRGKSEAGRGALIGLVLGAVGGAALATSGASSCEGYCFGPDLSSIAPVIGAVAGSIPGLLVGAVVGSMIHRDCWETVWWYRTGVCMVAAGDDRTGASFAKAARGRLHVALTPAYAAEGVRLVAQVAF